jgi:predicted nucleic-acid-binding Zn-ribbon protein
VTAPTCTEKGYTTNKCSRCGDSYSSNETPATGHINTTTKTVQPTCMEDGYTVTSCADCGYTISKTTIPSSGAHSYTTTMRLSDAVKAEYDRGYTDHIEFIQNEDFDVKVCSGCGDIDIDTMTFRYSDYETSAMMLGYINDFREANGVFPLEIDNSLINKTRSMMSVFLQNGYI